MGIIYQPPWREFPGLPQEAAGRLARNFDEVTRMFSRLSTESNYDCIVDGRLTQNNVPQREFRTVWEAVDIMSDLGYTAKVHVLVLAGAEDNYSNLVETQPGTTKRCDNIIVSGLGETDVTGFRPEAPPIFWSWLDDTTMDFTEILFIRNMNVLLPGMPGVIIGTELTFENCIVSNFGNDFRGTVMTLFRCGLDGWNLDLQNFFAYHSWIAPVNDGGGNLATIGDVSRASTFVAKNCIFSGAAQGQELIVHYQFCEFTDCAIDGSWGLL